MICSRCIYSEDIPGISFDSLGVCNYCRQVESLTAEFGTGSQKGEQAFKKILDRIKIQGKGKAYDCVVGVSGGTDSSYLLMKACDWGLRPLAVHYDNTWNSAVATENIRKVTSALNIDLYTYVINNKEHDAIKLAFMRSGVQEFDTDTDLAFVQVLRAAAAKYRISFILEGHSFIEEGISPANNNYFDGGYIKDIVSRFGTYPIRTYPLMTFWKFLKWVLIYRQSFIRPLWYIKYSKKEAQQELYMRTGWLNYGGHHLENRASAFAHEVWIPRRYGMDYRILSLAATARKGEISREFALDCLGKPRQPTQELEAYVRKRLGLNEAEYSEIMIGSKRFWTEFKTYKKRFEMLRPLFALLADAQLVPKSFYLKYCFPIKPKK
jgi:hypothetical protein